MPKHPLVELAEAKSYNDLLDCYEDYDLNAIAEVAHLLRRQESYSVALSLYHYLLSHQENAELQYGVGLCYGKTYQYQAALHYLSQAFKEHRADGANYYAYILERNSHMAEAKQWYEYALNNGYADDLWTLSHYAYFLEKYDQPELAEQAYQTVLNLNPNYSWAIKRYALFFLHQNQRDRADQLMKTALESGNTPFMQINYLEYLILRGDQAAYEEYLRSLDYAKLALPFQTVIDLLDYFWRYLLAGEIDMQKLAVYYCKTQQLQETIHRDFDDLTHLLTQQGRDLNIWQQLTQLLIK